MSEQGWRDFLPAEGVDDALALHGVPTALFALNQSVPAIGSQPVVSLSW
jgi:hypothetical protein